MKIIDYDIIYLSYDEPNAEKNYADLLSKVPWAKRIHGIKGSDAAHKACANLSETDRFITVDGDNIIKPEFLNQVLDFDEHADLEHSVISWCGRNIINGLMYGNGGLKCWPKQYVLDMKTHENADPDNPNAQVDFCWDLKYIQQNSWYSDVYNNETPHQAWRAGFREGVKMSLNRGAPVKNLKEIWWQNYHRLLIWMNVGADIKNGMYCLLGAREGCYKTMCTNWDHTQTRDFEYLNSLWKENNYGEHNVVDAVENIGTLVRNELSIPVSAVSYTHLTLPTNREV